MDESWWLQGAIRGAVGGIACWHVVMPHVRRMMYDVGMPVHTPLAHHHDCSVHQQTGQHDAQSLHQTV